MSESTAGPAIDPQFCQLPLKQLADAALTRAAQMGAQHADLRCDRLREGDVRVRDGRLEGVKDGAQTRLAVRVVHDGMWGFAAGMEPAPSSAALLAERAVDVARISRGLANQPIELAKQPACTATWVSSCKINPFDVPDAEKCGLLADWSQRLLAADGVDHVYAKFRTAQENKFYADLGGSMINQQRVRVYGQLLAMSAGGGSSAQTMRSLGPAVGRGWEHMTGDGWDWTAELEAIPRHLAEKAAAPTVVPGEYDLVIDPTNLWLTIHESIGHATELDRALGYEAAYAGTTFATLPQLGQLQYGSELMNVSGDRTAEHGLATIGYDDEGVAAQRFDIVRDGVFVGYQTDRRTAQLAGLGRSNGCAFGSPGRLAVQRMANVSLQPQPDGPSTAELIAGVDRGIYVVGDGSFSIDMQRCNFQFTGQRFYRIEKGQLAGQLRDVAYQGNTLDFWRSLAAVGGPGTYLLSGADLCGKGQPIQAAAASHGCPAALFRRVRIVNTASEAGL